MVEGTKVQIEVEEEEVGTTEEDISPILSKVTVIEGVEEDSREEEGMIGAEVEVGMIEAEAGMMHLRGHASYAIRRGTW